MKIMCGFGVGINVLLDIINKKIILMHKLKHCSILYVEDDPITQENISSYLKRQCKTLYLASNGKDGYDSFVKNSPDIVITDIQMPKLNGLEMAKKIRKISIKTQIIITSAYSQEEYLLKAINLHLIQYIIKPLSIIKIKEALLSCESYLEGKPKDKVYLSKDLFYNTQEKELTKTNQIVSLSKKERALLELFIKNHPSTLSYESIENNVYDACSSKNAIKLLIKSLREKTSKNTITNVSGFGYKIHLDKNE